MVVLGAIPKVLRKYAWMFDFGSENLDNFCSDARLLFVIFYSFLIEAGVDLFSAYVERRQGIRTELWVHDLSVSMMFSLMSINFGILLFYLYLIKRHDLDEWLVDLGTNTTDVGMWTCNATLAAVGT